MTHRRNPRTSIRMRVAISIGAVTIAAAVILSLVSGQVARQQIEQERGKALISTARHMLETLDRGMFERYREIQMLAELSDIRNPAVSTEDKRRLLERVQTTHGQHAWIGIAGPDGIAKVGTQGYLEGRDISKRPWFKKGMTGPYVGDVHDAMLLAKMLPNPSGDPIYLLDVAAPILGTDNKPVGVICSHLHWRWSREILKSLPTGAGIDAFLLSRDGLVLDGPQHKVFDRFEGDSAQVEGALHAYQESFYMADWRGGREFLTAHVSSKGFQNYPGLGWRLVLRQDKTIAFAAANSLQRRILLIGLLLGGAFAVAGWWVAGRLTGPVEAIARDAEAISDGDLTRELPIFGGRDEIARLSSALASMLTSLRQEIATRRAAEDNLRLAATVFDSSVEGIVISDAENRIVTVNQAFCNITGYTQENVIGENPRILNSGRHPASFYQDMWRDLGNRGRWQGEVWNRRKNGDIFPEWLVITAVKDGAGRLSHYVAVFSDLTERKLAEERIRFIGNHDALTGLPNRHLLKDRLDQMLARAQRMETHLALIFIDLDRFKNINDTLGHQIGDELLKLVGNKLKTCLRPGDTLARQGGDEFVVLADDIENSDSVAPILDNMLNAFRNPFMVGIHALTVTPSIGIALYPDDGKDMETLLKHADIAMYRAKETGRNNYQFFLPVLNEHMVTRLDMEARLRHALERNQLALHYQPQVDVASGRIIGAEALLRWNEPVLGNIPPVDFIPLAEETGLILPIGDWVLRSAISAAAHWARSGTPVRIAVNISAKQLRHRDLAGNIGQILAETGLNPDLLEVELTESVMMATGESERVNLEQIQRLGLELSLDDFGTGYSSLSYLHQLQVSTLKIDRSFISNLDNPEGAMLTETIIRMAKSLDLKIVAEGVETQSQFDFIRYHKVDFYQGYYFSKPLPHGDFEQLLRAGAR
ncbi:MAG: EAL domain-containing protein [Sulfuricella denitrificans]|nr:EAL domain-containing protein [Sulfuricella denitrificans]